MKILLLAGAHDVHVVRWANKLSENGNEIHLCYNCDHKPHVDKYNERVILHELKIKSPYGYYLNILQLNNIIQKVSPDIINIHYASGYGTLGRLTKFPKILISVYGSDVYDFPYKSKLNMRIIRKNLLSATNIASTSYSMAKQTSNLINYPLEKIYITPFGVDVDKFKKVSNKCNKEFLIASIKKLSPKYGIKYGILAVDYLVKNLLKDKNNEIKLKYFIYGEGEEEQELKLLVKQLNLENIIKFKGRIPNDLVPKVLNQIDVFIGTSILNSESFGVAIVEAMACEVPVIVTDVDGFKEVVDNGNCGILVEKRDYKSMAQELYKLMKDSSKRNELGKCERERVCKYYKWDDNVKFMEQIYKEMLYKAE